MSQPAATPLEWTLSRDAAPHGGYVAWEALHRAPPPVGSDWYAPVFLRLRQAAGGPADLAGAIRAVLAEDIFLISRDERAILLSEAEHWGSGWPHEVRLVAYLAYADLHRVPNYSEVLHVGAPVLMERASLVGRQTGAGSALPLPRHDRAGEPRPATIIAAIDDGIAFLNARFRRDPGHTRIAGIWLQAPEVLDPSGVVCGRALFADEIDTLLAGGEREAEVYRAINRSLDNRADQRSTNHLVSHGTHVLDLAAGAAPEGEAEATMRALPILAVQLPPAALRDTSGRRLEGYVVQGLRWLMAQTLRRAAGGPVAPLVVNLSLGSLAGPGNASAFLADWFSYELQRYARLAPDGVLRIVAAYGNARRARLVARTELRASKDLMLDWRVLPDDHTPSFAELRTGRSRAGALRLTLQPPGDAIPPLDGIPWPEPGECWSVGTPPIAMVTGVAEAEQRMVHIAVAPTAGAATLSPPGCWKLGVTRDDEAPAKVSIRVQRDDTPAGYRTLGRQSWLDHPLAWDWDDETRDWTRPLSSALASDESPVTREGTAVAFAGATDEAVVFVGSVRRETGDPDRFRPALYSASGVVAPQLSGESVGPTLAALGEDGAILTGRRASGVLSGSVARLSGTSAAAPCVTRALALLIERTTGRTTPTDELAALLGRTATSQKSPLIGHGVLSKDAAMA